MRWALASSLLISCSSTPEAEPTLLEAFSEFASCEGAEAAALLAARRDFFHAYPTETAVRALPQHVARNEQEQLLRLQRAVLRPGALVTFANGLDAASALRGCDRTGRITLLACTQDGTFDCAVEVGCNARGVGTFRVGARWLRPGEACGLACGRSSRPCCVAPAAQADGYGWSSSSSSAAGGADGRITTEAIGRTIAFAVAEADDSAASGRLPEELSSLGDSALPGLSCARV